MRVVWFLSVLALLCLGAGGVRSHSVEPDLAVLAAPQVDDVTLLQMNAQAHSTSSSVAALESELAAALASQAELQAELASESEVDAEADSEVDAETAAEVEFAAMQASEAEAEALSQAQADADSVAALEAEFEAQAAAEVEAEQAASISTLTDSETEAEAESESTASLEAQLAAELEADVDAELEQELAAAQEEQEPKAMAETHAESEPAPAAAAAKPAEAAAPAAAAPAAAAPASPEAVTVTGKAVDTPSGTPAPAPAAPAAGAAKGERVVNRLSLQPSPKQQLLRKFRHSVVGLQRSNPNAAPDTIELVNGKKLHKTWIVSPNLRPEVPKPKPAPKHSRERVLTPKEKRRLSRTAETADPRRPLSAVRRQFLRQNPELLEAKLRKRAYSPAASWLLALRRGHFRNMRLDPPMAAAAAVAEQTGVPVTLSQNKVEQHVTVRHHAPSVRQRAEVNALRAASRTLRRINGKSREFQRALRALARARKQVQGEIHRHHVERAKKARAEADKAARRAAWSSLLQHKALRRELLRHMARVARRKNMSRDARRRAIAALIRHDLSPAQRRKLHAFIRRSTRQQRRSAKRAARRHAKKTKVTVAVAEAAVKASKAEEPKKPAAAPAISEKDQKAIEALVARIRATVASKKAAPAPAAPAKPAAPATPAPAAAPASKPAAAPAAEPAAAPAAAPKAPAKVTPIRFLQQRLQSAESLAAEAEEEALLHLHSSSEMESDPQVMLHTDAKVHALAQDTEEWLRANGF